MSQEVGDVQARLKALRHSMFGGDEEPEEVKEKSTKVFIVICFCQIAFPVFFVRNRRRERAKERTLQTLNHTKAPTV
jgi:hypothetical protein